MSDQDGRQVRQVKLDYRPANDDRKGWLSYWRLREQPWRKEPEIDAERQKYLMSMSRHHRVIEKEKSFSPLKGVLLSRADIEWLLATLGNGQGPVYWNDLKQRDRQGLDLSGVDLRGVDLSFLPLAETGLDETRLEGVNLYGVHLEGANLFAAHLEGANLFAAHLEKAFLAQAHLQKTNLSYSHLEGAKLAEARMEGADLSSSYLDGETNLHSSSLYSQEIGSVILADIHWGDVNIAIVDWSVLLILGDETQAWQSKNDDDDPIEQEWHFEYQRRAVRAYRQLAVVLRNQGLNDEAARFTYRAQLMQRKLFWHQRKILRFLGSLFLDLLSGYGYKPIRSFLAYLIVILTFATAYFTIGRAVGPALSPLGSVVFSMTSFHGRGFFPGGITLDDPLTVLAALEAFVGLLIEVTFIATLTRRLFGG